MAHWGPPDHVSGGKPPITLSEPRFASASNCGLLTTFAASAHRGRGCVAQVRGDPSDGEVVQLLAALHRGNQPLGPKAPSRPCLASVGRISVFRLHLGASKRATPAGAAAERRIHVRTAQFVLGDHRLELANARLLLLFERSGLGFQFLDYLLGRVSNPSDRAPRAGDLLISARSPISTGARLLGNHFLVSGRSDDYLRGGISETKTLHSSRPSYLWLVVILTGR